MLVPILFTLAFIAFSVPFVAAPFRQRGRPVDRPLTAAGAATPAARYEATLLALRDLEFDRQLGVVDEEDYARLRGALMVEAAAAVETSGEQDDDAVLARIEAAILARRNRAAPPQPAGEAIARFCPQCGRAVEAAARFCRDCGASLKQPPPDPAPESPT